MQEATDKDARFKECMRKEFEAMLARVIEGVSTYSETNGTTANHFKVMEGAAVSPTSLTPDPPKSCEIAEDTAVLPLIESSVADVEEDFSTTIDIDSTVQTHDSKSETIIKNKVLSKSDENKHSSSKNCLQCSSQDEKVKKQMRDLKAARYEVTAARNDAAKQKTDYILELQKLREELNAQHEKQLEIVRKEKDSRIEDKANSQIDKLRKVRQNLIVEIHVLKKKAVAVQDTHEKKTEILRAEIQGLKDEIVAMDRVINEELRPELARLKAVESDRNTLRSNLIALQKRVELVLSDNEHHTSYFSLLQDFDELKVSQEVAKPLLEIGVAIRCRFLERLREKLSNLDRDEVDLRIIKRGNAAAHAAQGEADLALFKGKFVSEESPLKATLDGFYKYQPQYGGFPKMVKRLLDCDNTISVVELEAGNLDWGGLKSEYLNTNSKVVERYNHRDCDEQFEENSENIVWLERIEEITEEVVELSRRSRYY